MDPITVVGLVASIVQLINTTATVIQYLNDVKDAPKTRARLAREASDLLALLTDLRYRVEEAESTEPWFTNIRSLGLAGGPLSQFQEAIETLEKKLRPESGLRKLGKTLLWTLEKGDIELILSKIERLKTFVSLALQNDHFKLSIAIKDDLTGVKEEIGGTNRAVRALQEIHQDSESRRIVDWLSPLNFSSKQNDFFGRRQQGTGEWLLADGIFQSWLRGDEKVLWCTGLPGSGKTILASIIIDHLNQHFEQEDIAIAYIYCSYKEQEYQTVVNLISSLLQQVVQKNPTVSDDILSLHNKHDKKGTRPTLSEWSRLLQSEVRRLSKVFVVIDALDECPESSGIRRDFLTEILKLQNTQILVTSRHIPAVGREFEMAARLEVRATDEDVERYLKDRIRKEPRLARHITAAPDLEETIVTTVTEKAKGMFLLAQLHMDSLAKRQNRRDVRIALENLPKGVDDTYDEAMQRIRNQDEEDARFAERVLYWISYALRPLSVIELQHALAVEVGDIDVDNEAFPDEDLLVSVCAGLVTVDQESNIIRLVHYTTQQYFESIRAKQFPKAQTSIATICLTYLSFETFGKGLCRNSKESESRLHKYPFLRYAAQFWGDHARDGMEATVKELALEFLRRSMNFLCSIQVTPYLRLGYRSDDSHVPNMTRLHVIASFGLIDIARMLIEEGVDLNVQGDDRWTALHWAVQNEHEAAIKLLLDSGANIDPKNWEGNTALRLAVMKGHEALVRLFLDRGPNLEVLQIALHKAAESGHEAIVLLLLEKGSEIDSKDGVARLLQDWGETALHRAASRGCTAVVQLLLKAGASVNAKDRWGGTALHQAAQRGHKLVVRLLLEYGIDISTTDKSGKTALHRATKEGHETIVRVLLEQKADVHEKDGDGQTALHRAAEGGHETIVRVLLEQNADVHEKDGDGQTALHRAAEGGHETIVRVLLEQNADVHEKNGDGQTALELAAGNEHESVIMLLLDHMGEQSSLDKWLATARLRGAVDRGEEGTVSLLLKQGAVTTVLKTNLANGLRTDVFSVLHLAVAGEKEAVISLLLKNGADIAAIDALRRTALHWAAARGCETAVLILLENGADITAEDVLYHKTPLQLAAGQGFYRVTKLLLERGASGATRVKDIGLAFRNALAPGLGSGYSRADKMLEVKNASVGVQVHLGGRKTIFGSEHVAIAKLLIENGVDINAKDEFGQTSLHHVTELAGFYSPPERVVTELVKLLLANGVDTAARDAGGRTALFYAVVWNCESVVQLLLDNGIGVNTREKTKPTVSGASLQEEGPTALHLAAEHGSEAVMRLLLEYGADVDAKDDTGQTALHKAVQSGNETTVEMLLERGMNINTKDGNLGGMALHWAARQRRVLTVQYLITRGADLNAKDHKGETALDWAISEGYEPTVMLLTSLMSDSRSTGGKVRRIG